MKKIFCIILSIVMAAGSFYAVYNTDITSAYAATFKSECKKFSVNTADFKSPSLLKNNQSFTLKGKITANHKIKQIIITVYDRNQFKNDIKFSKKINSKTLNLKNYSSKIHFEKLTSGEKELKISLIDNKNRKVVITKNFTVLGKAKEPMHITSKCKIKASKGNVKNVTDSDDNTSWNSGTMTITFPKDKTVDGIFIKWYHISNNDYTLKTYSKNGNVLDTYDKKSTNMLHKYYTVSKGAVKAVIKLKKNDKGICALRVYEKEKVGVSVERWEPRKTGDCDLMVISAHRDDELLFFGGTIPYYANVRNKNVYTVFMSGNDRERVREAHASQWSMGIKTYPIFMGFEGGYHNGINGTLNDWGGEDYVLGCLVEKIRHYKPDVIVTHDVNGEYGHPTHKTTAYLVKKAIKIAADKSKYRDSYKKYGIWNVKKVYIHIYDKNKINMDWNKRYKAIDNKTAFELACVGYDKYYSQHGSWSMTSDTVKKYPSNKFGLYYSSVGKDKQKNDFFENIK
ncbi:MAG: PIG-L family deacetylase [Acetobacter sp.]|nr:PIG-L family deacetylase [Bacteroides sp.]MCM1342134.1 PIG-L family deacetylase [Acetobacter sp.]MCM1434353.1 PIG-L family deacetylase [Clostridiales bacterium]